MRASGPQTAQLRVGVEADGPDRHGPRIILDEAPDESGSFTGEQPGGLHPQEGADDAGHRPEHPRLRAGGADARRRAAPRTGSGSRAGRRAGTVSSCPPSATAAPCTSGLPASTAASLARNLVAKLSEPSTTTSYAATSSRGVRRRRSGPRAARRAARGSGGRGRARTRPPSSSPTSASANRTWRCRLLASTRSSSTTPIRATPAAPSASAAGQPRPPAPMMRTPAAGVTLTRSTRPTRSSARRCRTGW